MADGMIERPVRRPARRTPNRRGRRNRLPRFIIFPKKAIFVAGAVIVFAFLLKSVFTLPATAKFLQGVFRSSEITPGPLAGQIIYIDAGHGGIDPGACGQEIIEKDVTLSVALYLGARLEKDGAKAVYTRTGDYDLETEDKDDVEERIKLIKTSGATIAISLHCNSFTDSSEWGAQTFYSASKHSDSKRLAQLVQAQLIEETGTERDISSNLAHFILSNSEVPTVTVEMGFLTNRDEEKLLGSASYQQKIAECIRKAVLEFVAGEV